MMPEVGQHWEGGEEDPPDQITRVVHRWVTTSSDPCPQCLANEGLLFMNESEHPAHDHCACTLESVSVTLSLQSNTADLTAEATEEVYYGFVSEGQGPRSIPLPDGGSQEVSCEADSWTGTAQCEIYFAFVYKLYTYTRVYAFDEDVLGGPGEIEEYAYMQEVEFHGIEVHSG
jgi:hypothetical protein